MKEEHYLNYSMLHNLENILSNEDAFFFQENVVNCMTG